MTQYDTHLKSDGPQALRVANSTLSALGVDPENVVEIEVEITTGNGDQTITSFTSDGPGAGYIAQEMLNGVDWDEHGPREIEVDIVTEYPDSGSDEDTKITYRDGEPEAKDEEEVEDEEEEEEAVDAETDEEPDEPSGDEFDLPDEMIPNSPPHLALTAVAAYYTKVVAPGGGDGDESEGSEYDSEVRGVSARQLARSLDLPIEYNTLAKALAEAAQEYAVLEQNIAERGEGASDAYYHINDLGRAFLENNGPHADLADMDISLALEPELPTTEGREVSYEELLERREAATGGAKGRTYDGPRELYIEEPRVDEPQPVSSDTRYHEVLWTLAQWHAENGADTWASINELYEYTPFDFPSQGSFGAPASEVFLEYALVERRQVGNRSECRLNEAGWDEVERLGAPEAASEAENAAESTTEVAVHEG